jgi:hypothetical protein
MPPLFLSKLRMETPGQDPRLLEVGTPARKQFDAAFRKDIAAAMSHQVLPNGGKTGLVTPEQIELTDIVGENDVANIQRVLAGNDVVPSPGNAVVPPSGT